VTGTGLALWLLLSPGLASPQGVPAGARLDTIAAGLDVPWSLAFAPDGRVFLTERAGRVRVLEHGKLRPAPWATLPVVPPADSGAGLLGLALAPDFPVSGAIFLVGSFRTGSGELENRLLRLTDSAGVGVAPRVVLGRIPSARAHAGSAVAFGPDGFLYLSAGDAFRPERASDTASLGGKILRLRPDGTVPPDNPVPGSPVYALGLRNVQGLAWDPESGALFATEHGPSNWPWEGGRRDHDELNVIRRGVHYGWPLAIGVARDSRFADPIAVWTPAIAPSGIAFYSGHYAPWRGSLLVGALKGRELRRLTLTRESKGGWRVTAHESLYAPDLLGRIRAVAVAPDGAVWFTTSNRQTPDGRPDDRIYRLTLPRSAHR
jgi:glucose/arabinose dehydrogenase